MTNIYAAAKLIQQSSTIQIITHVNPDGDGLGCQAALACALTHLKKHVVVSHRHTLPVKYDFLRLGDYQAWPQQPIDLIITVDCPTLQRLDFDLTDLKVPLLKIDHHLHGEPFGTINIVDSSAAATGILVAFLLAELDVQITPAIATALYTTLVCDTDCFKYNTSPELFQFAADLLAASADQTQVIEHLQQGRSLAATRLLARVILEAEFLQQDQIAIGVVSQGLLVEYGVTDTDLEGFVEALLAIQHVSVAILLIELKVGVTRASLRSKYHVDVRAIAAEFQGGGGHQKAAGFTVQHAYQDVKQQLLRALT